MPRMGGRHHYLVKPIQLNFERKITKVRIRANIRPSQFLAQQHARKLLSEGHNHNKCHQGKVGRGTKTSDFRCVPTRGSTGVSPYQLSALYLNAKRIESSETAFKLFSPKRQPN